MTSQARLALARIHTVDVAKLMARRLRQAGYHEAAAIVIETATDVAEDLAREREIAAAQLQEHEHG